MKTTEIRVYGGDPKVIVDGGEPYYYDDLQFTFTDEGLIVDRVSCTVPEEVVATVSMTYEELGQKLNLL